MAPAVPGCANDRQQQQPKGKRLGARSRVCPAEVLQKVTKLVGKSVPATRSRLPRSALLATVRSCGDEPLPLPSGRHCRRRVASERPRGAVPGSAFRPSPLGFWPPGRHLFLLQRSFPDGRFLQRSRKILLDDRQIDWWHYACGLKDEGRVPTGVRDVGACSQWFRVCGGDAPFGRETLKTGHLKLRPQKSSAAALFPALRPR